MWMKDGKAAGKYIVLDGYRIYHPTPEQYLAAGYEWVEPVPPEPVVIPKRYSKYKIILALGDQWPSYKLQIEQSGMYDLFVNAEYLEEGDPLFDAFMADVPEELKERLDDCLWD